MQDKRRSGAYGRCEPSQAPPNAPPRLDSAPVTTLALAWRPVTDPALLRPGTTLVTADRPGTALVTTVRPRTALVTVDRPRTAFVTADRPGSVLVARLDALAGPVAAADDPAPVRSDQLPPGVSDEPQGAPRAPAIAETTGPAWGSPGRSQPTRLAAEPLGATRVREEAGATRVREESGATRVREESGAARDSDESGTAWDSDESGTSRVSEEAGTTWVREEAGRSRACDTGRANVGAATPTPRTLAEATPPSKIRQLLTRHSTSS